MCVVCVGGGGSEEMVWDVGVGGEEMGREDVSGVGGVDGKRRRRREGFGERERRGDDDDDGGSCGEFV